MASTPRKSTRSNSSSSEADSRIVRMTGDRDELRAPRGATADRERTEKDGTVMSAADRMRMVRDEFAQEALPKVPTIPGKHLCWLNTSSSWDPISKRQRLGYEPVTYAMLPKGYMAGNEQNKANSGQFDGVVTCNEMALFMIDEDMYQAIMQEFHHNQPMSEEEAIRARLEQIEEATDGQGRPLKSKDSRGREVSNVEGFDDIAVRRPAPQHYA